MLDLICSYFPPPILKTIGFLRLDTRFINDKFPISNEAIFIISISILLSSSRLAHQKELT